MDLRPKSGQTSLTRQRAWVLVGINQLAFPGLGSILAGRRVGYAQAVVMVAGFILVMAFFAGYLAAFYAYVTTPGSTEQQFLSQIQRDAGRIKYGGLLVAVAWLWSGLTCLSILKKARTMPPPLPPGLSPRTGR